MQATDIDMDMAAMLAGIVPELFLVAGRVAVLLYALFTPSCS